MQREKIITQIAINGEQRYCLLTHLNFEARNKRLRLKWTEQQLWVNSGKYLFNHTHKNVSHENCIAQ